jgi:hypothetical protein
MNPNDPNDLIERMERETGQRVDDNDGDNNAMAGLFGAMARLLGQTPPSYTERDDVAVGLLLRHQMSPEGKRERAQDEMIANMLFTGISPDDVKKIFG